MGRGYLRHTARNCQCLEPLHCRNVAAARLATRLYTAILTPRESGDKQQEITLLSQRDNGRLNRFGVYIEPKHHLKHSSANGAGFCEEPKSRDIFVLIDALKYKVK